GDQLEVGRDFVGRGAPEELVPLAQLDLHHFGQLRALLQHAEVHSDQLSDLDHRIKLAGQLAALMRHEPGHLLAEERHQDLFLRLEVEVNRPAGDPGLARDVRDPRVVVAGPREHADGRVDDLLWLFGISHIERASPGSRAWVNRRSFYGWRRNAVNAG